MSFPLSRPRSDLAEMSRQCKQLGAMSTTLNEENRQLSRDCRAKVHPWPWIFFLLLDLLLLLLLLLTHMLSPFVLFPSFLLSLLPLRPVLWKKALCTLPSWKIVSAPRVWRSRSLTLFSLVWPRLLAFSCFSFSCPTTTTTNHQDAKESWSKQLDLLKEELEEIKVGALAV